MAQAPSTRDEEKRVYASTVTALEGMYDFHPDCFDKLSDADRNVLSKFYFAGRDIDVDDIFAYREKLLGDEPGIKKQAEAALKNLYEVQGITPEPGEY